MRMRGILRILVCGSVLLSAASAMSAELHGRSSTQYLWFNNIFNDKKQAEFLESLSFSVTKLDPSDKLSLNGYGMMSQDVMNGQGFNGRLFYLYADYHDLMNIIDIRAGRQFVNFAAGSAIVDGGLIDLKNIGPVAFSVMGGRNVYFGIDRELTHAGDAVFGAAATLAGFSKTDAEISYFLKFDQDGVAREQLGAMFKQYLFSCMKLYGNTRFDMPSETFTEVLAGVKYFPLANLTFTAEWFQSYPTFDYTSIYSVFAVNRYQEGAFRADYTVNDKIALHGAYKRQDFGDNTAGDVYEAGVKVRPIDKFIVDVSYDRRQGYAGNLDGVTLDLLYDPTPHLQLAGGFSYDVYQRDSMTGDTDAQNYWLGARYKLNKTISFDARVQDSINIRFQNDWSGRVAFNYDF